ncbi:MAG: hypothetical protein WBW49_09970, partial [Candidatus Acidiferrum sp.]
MIRPWLFVCVLMSSGMTVAAQSASSPDTPEPESTEDIAKATTEPEFLSPWVSYVPASSNVPSPRAFFGRIMGAPGELV